MSSAILDWRTACRPMMSASSAKGRMAGSGSGPPLAWRCGTEGSSSARPAIPSRGSAAWTGIQLACCGSVAIQVRCNTGRMAQAAPLSPKRPSPMREGRGSCVMLLGRFGWAAMATGCCASMAASSSICALTRLRPALFLDSCYRFLPTPTALFGSAGNLADSSAGTAPSSILLRLRAVVCRRKS